MPQLKVHNVRFYNPEPTAIYCMSLHRKDKKLAVSRSDATLEIWNINHTIFIERTIASTSENFSIEGLVWCDQRLFSVGLHGLLIEYDLQQLNIKNRAAVTGEAAYCLDIKYDKSELAIGTEQGYINIFSVTSDGALFEKFLDKQEGRIICIKYEPTGEFLVSGGIDAIRIWNVKSGHAIHKLSTGRSNADKETIVWCLQITSDFTIISGDSRGKLTFWDGKVGAQIESYHSHRADILSICISADQKSLCCAGVDPSIINYERITVKEGTQKFVKSIERKIHEHDVRAMVLCDNKLYSGGADGYLACSYHPPKTLIKNPPLLQSPCVCLSREGRLILLRYAQHVEVWSLSECNNTDVSYRGIVGLKNEPKKLIYYQRSVKNYEDEESSEGIICAALSNDGKLMFVSTNSGSRLFELHYEEEKLQLLNVDLESAEVPCLQALFSRNNQQLIVAPNTGGLQIYKIKNNVLNVVQNIEFNTDDVTDVVTYLTISNCSKYLVVGDPRSNIVIYTIKQNKWVVHAKLPKHLAPPTSIAINSKSLNVVVAYSDNKVVEFSIRQKQFTDFSKFITPFSKLNFIKNITFDARANQDHIMLLHDDSTIYIIDKNKDSSKKSSKKAKIESATLSINCSTIKKYKHLAHLEWLKDDEVVAVEVNPLSIIKQLPPAFEQNKFGQK